jgi:probable rRNA maturation factor
MILNRQRRVRVPLAELETFLSRARRALGLPADSFTVCLVTNAEIARWNRTYRGKRGPTDVLSFPADRERPRRLPASYLGDIAIAPQVALRNAGSSGRKAGDEMRILLLHGMLHLMGYDHETDNGQMDRRERRLRRKLGLE